MSKITQDNTANLEGFVPPQVIETEHLIMRPFASAEEAIELLKSLGEIDTDHIVDTRICQDEELYKLRNDVGFYASPNSMFKEWAIFVKPEVRIDGQIEDQARSEDGEFIGVVFLVDYGNSQDIPLESSYSRYLKNSARGCGYGTEILRGMIENLIDPAIGRFTRPTQFVSRCNEDDDVIEYIAVNSAPVYKRHWSQVKFTNYASILSNLKGGMGIETILPDCYNEGYGVRMIYPPKNPGLDLEIKEMFKTMSKLESPQTSEEDKQGLKTDLQDKLHKILSETPDPNLIITIANLLFPNEGDIDSASDEMKDKIKNAYSDAANINSKTYNDDGSPNVNHAKDNSVLFEDRLYTEVKDHPASNEITCEGSLGEVVHDLGAEVLVSSMSGLCVTGESDQQLLGAEHPNA